MSKLEDLIETNIQHTEDGKIIASATFKYRTLSEATEKELRPMSDEQFGLIPKFGAISDINALVMEHQQKRTDFTDIAGFRLFYSTALTDKNIIVSQKAMNELIKLLTENTLLMADNQKLKALLEVAKRN